MMVISIPEYYTETRMQTEREEIKREREGKVCQSEELGLVLFPSTSPSLTLIPLEFLFFAPCYTFRLVFPVIHSQTSQYLPFRVLTNRTEHEYMEYPKADV